MGKATEDQDILLKYSGFGALPAPATVWTIGHSTRTLDEMVALLRRNGVQAIADVRRFPGSRRLPQFGQTALQEGLANRQIDYRWVPELGGRRRPVPNTPNSAWRNVSFRGYADHLESEEFKRGLETLLTLACAVPTAMMCAELLWWRCHRSLVADVLKLHGVKVVHILDEKQLTIHPYTSPARIIDGRLRYVGAG